MLRRYAAHSQLMRTTDRGPRAGRRATPANSSAGESAPSGERFDAFIRYKRISADEHFVDHLCQALADREPSRTVWVDRTRIEPAVDWLSRATRGIDASRALIYVITPESVASEDCRRELDLAIARNKLIVPVLLRKVADRSALHPRVSRLNWIPAGPGDDPGRIVDAVARALEDDLDWRDEQTYLGARAGQWDSRQRKRGFLLHGEELGIAETWLGQAVRHPDVPPTQLHLDYITAGRKDANLVRNRWIARRGSRTGPGSGIEWPAHGSSEPDGLRRGVQAAGAMTMVSAGCCDEWSRGWGGPAEVRC